MKRFFAILIALLMVVSSCQAISMLKYLDQGQVFYDILNEERYDDFIQAVKDFQTEHPSLMPDEWLEKFTDMAIQARDAFVPDFNTEYDPFEDLELKWFGDHKAATPEDPYVILDGTSGLIMSFCLPVDSWVYYKEFVALINGSERLTGDVENWDNKIVDHQEYETFYVDLGIFNSKNVEAEQYDSLAFRFYGKNKDEHVDIFINDETMGYFRQVTAETVTAQDVKDLIYPWEKAIDDIVDETIIPAAATRMMKNNPDPIYPATIQTADFWKLQDSLSKEVAQGKRDYGYGLFYFFPCEITAIHTPDSNDPYTYWSVNIYEEYGRFLAAGTIILDYALTQEGWLPDEKQVGDRVMVAAAYAGRGTWTTVFILGFDDEAKSIARTFLK